jgi:hypothetical protein
MTHKIDADADGVFIITEASVLQPTEQSNFSFGDSVEINYIADQQAIVTDLTVDTANPYTEIWSVIYIDTHTADTPYEHQTVNTEAVGKMRYDQHPIDLALWAITVLTTCWMLSIIINTIL